jgi:hypothetical protein
MAEFKDFLPRLVLGFHAESLSGVSVFLCKIKHIG